MSRLMLKMAVIGLVALTLSIRVAAAGDAQAVSDDFSVTLGRTTCFGECPEYSVTIDAQGLVRYEGRKFVRVEGIQTDRLPVARVAALFAQIERIRFFDFNESYRTIHTPDGEISVTDLPTTMVSVTYGGRSKQILDYLGAPAPLKQLEKEIDAVARTKRWVTLDDETLQQMIRDGWSPSAAERSELLRKALQEDEVAVIKRLLENGTDPNGLYGGSTPLMMVRSEAAARSVLAAGGDPRALDANGQTPLFKAAYLAPAVTDVFLKAGVPPYQPDVNGHTALSQAACAGNAGAVELLLARGRDSAWRPSAEAALKCARESQPYERLYQQHLIDTDPAFIKSFDAVIALLEQALAKGPRK